MNRMLYPQWILEQPLPPTGKYLLIVLNTFGWPCWPTIEKITKRSGLARRTVQLTLHRLRQGGYIKTSSDGKALTYELVEIPDSAFMPVKGGAPRAPQKRTRCASGAHQMRRRGAPVAPGSEEAIEEINEERRLSPQQLAELRAAPPESDAPGTRYESLAEAIRQRLGAGVPLPGPGGTHPGPAPNNQDAAEAWRRLNLLKAGRLTA